MQWSGPNRRRRLLAVGLLLALLAGGLTFLAVGRSRFAWDQACTLARRQLPGLLGADVGLGAARWTRPDARSASTALGHGPGRRPAHVQRRRARGITVAGVQPLSGRLELDRVRVIRPRIWLDLTPPAASREVRGLSAADLEHLEVDTLEVAAPRCGWRSPRAGEVEVAGVELSWRTRRRDAEFTLRTSQGLVDLANGTTAAGGRGPRGGGRRWRPAGESWR